MLYPLQIGTLIGLNIHRIMKKQSLRRTISEFFSRNCFEVSGKVYALFAESRFAESYFAESMGHFAEFLLHLQKQTFKAIK